MKDTILSALSRHRDDMARFTGELVAIPTANPPGRRYSDCVEAIAKELGRLGLLSVSHGPEEYIVIDDMFSSAAVYALTATRLLSK